MEYYPVETRNTRFRRKMYTLLVIEKICGAFYKYQVGVLHKNGRTQQYTIIADSVKFVDTRNSY